LIAEIPEPGSFVFLEVDDNGCGMDKKTLLRLFDPFFTTKFTGRGLGMSSVIGIVRMHNGALFVESEPGKGTTFTVLFPVSDSVQPNMALPSPTAEPELSADSVHTLSGLALVVDDEKPVLKTCRKMVELCGFTVITAHDGMEAVAQFREHADEIDIVLLDLTMPNMDGITAMGEIYRIKPDARVILSCGFNRDELSGRLAAAAPNGFIRKPYNIKVLATELQRVMMDNETGRNNPKV
jgi:CheY-like chemotaxis protein